MRLLLCLVLPIAAWCAPAALAKEEALDESLKPLLRVKRADEQVVFGNHQNEAKVVKKSDPGVSNNEEADLDKKANIDLDSTTSNDDDENTGSDDVSADTNDVSTATDDESTEDNSETPTEDEEQTMENVSEDKSDEKEENDISQNFPSWAQGRQQKRAAPRVPLSAEDMVSMDTDDAAGARSKRDLTAEDIYQWLESGQGPRDYYPEYELPEYDNSLEDLVLDDYPPGPLMGYETEYPEYTDYTETDAEDLSNKELMEYLLGYIAANEIPEEESPMSEVYPGAVKEEWEEIVDEPEDTIQYEPIVYNGVPGIFIPMPPQSNVVSKREYFNLDSGLRKRNDFYPYSMEPEDGRWGAFVDQQQEEKRTADAYERLLRMAEALNPSDTERYFDELGYQKK